MRAVIVDDELIGINVLKTLIERHTPSVKVVATAQDPSLGIKLVEDYHPEILFLDISMPQMDGFELLENLQYNGFKLVFTTAHDKYAIKAIKNRAVDYLLKPIDIDELKSCISRISAERQAFSDTQKQRFIELHVKSGIIFVKPDDIIWLEAGGSYTTFYLINNIKHVVSKTLKDFEGVLNPSVFYRCHKSYIINLEKVVRFVNTDGFSVEMQDGSMVQILKRNKQEFLTRINA